MEYTITTRPLPPAIPIESIRELALAVNELAHGQNYHAGIILRWLERVEIGEEGYRNSER